MPDTIEDLIALGESRRAAREALGDPTTATTPWADAYLEPDERRRLHALQLAAAGEREGCEAIRERVRIRRRQRIGLD